MSRTCSFWLDQGRFGDVGSSEDLPSHLDLLIIGGGMSGMSCAYWVAKLKEKNKENGIHSIALLEASQISSGASGRNGGHLWTTSSNPYALQNKKLVEDFLNEHHLHDVVEYYKTTGLVEYPSNPPSHSKSSEAAQWWPAKMVHHLAMLCMAMGVKIYTNTRVKKVEWADGENQDHFKVETEKGLVWAKNIVYATNAYTGELLEGLKGVIVPTRGQVICSEPLPLIFKESLCFGPSGDEYLIQRRKDGRVILGGFRRNAVNGKSEVGISSDNEIDPNISKCLRNCLKEITKREDIKIEYEWTGIMGFSKDDKPLIGELPKRSPHTKAREYLAAGYTGNGMAYAFKAGQSIALLLLHGHDEDCLPYSPLRFPNLLQHSPHLISKI